MASSQYSATPVPPARIRVVAHPPLAPVRAWLPLPSPTSLHRPPVVADLLAAVSRLLQGRTDIACEIQGFTVLTDSPLSVLDPINDILDIKVAPAPLPPFPDILAPPIIPPSVAPAAQAAAVPLPPSSSSATNTDSSSDADSYSDMDESSDDDAAPEVIPSKRPLALANGHGPAAAPAPDGSDRPAKRQRTTSLSSPSSSSTSSSSSSSNSSPSSSSSSDSDGDSDSDSSTSGADTPVSPRRALAALVPPGEGKRRTRKRNQRKRVLKAARKRERALGAVPAGSAAAPMVEMVIEAEKVGGAAPALASALVAPAEPAPPKSALPRKALAVAAALPDAPSSLPHPSAELAGPSSPRAARKYSTGGEPGISLVSAGTRNTPASERGAAGSRAGVSKAQKRGFYREPQPAVGGGRAAAGERAPLPERSSAAQERPALPAQGSPVYTPTSPAFSPPTMLDDEPALAPAAAPASTAAPARPDDQPQPRAPRFVPPSKRTDLPPNLVITSVNVEAAGWEPGLGRVVKGTSRDWVAPEAAAPSVEAQGQDVAGENEEDVQGEGSGWEGWRSADEVERAWDKLRPLRGGDAAAKDGARVAVKVLELDPSTLAPTLALKYGRLLRCSSSPSPLRIELHPDCLAPSFDAADTEWYGDYDEAEGDETAYHAKPRIRFGEDLFTPEHEDGDEATSDGEGVWEGEWEGADVRLVVNL